MALLIKASNDKIEATKVTPKNGKTFELKELQNYVGGYIQILPLRTEEQGWIICDEEGKLKNKKPNHIATNLAYVLNSLRVDDYLCGDILFCFKDEIN